VQKEMNEVYNSIAELLHCSSDEVAMMESATVAWTKCFYSIPFKQGDVILTCEHEYAANYVAMLQVAKRQGVIIKVIPSDGDGQLSLSEMELAAADPNVKLIAISHVPTNGGCVNPAEEVGALKIKFNIPYYLLDACQSVGQLNIDVNKIGCDMLTATGRKYIRGPRGTGFMFAKRSTALQLEPFPIDHYGAPWSAPDEYTMQPSAKRFEFWECNVANRLGLGVAVRHCLTQGIDAIEKKIISLADLLRAELSKLSGVEVMDIGKKKCGIVTFVAPLPAKQLKGYLLQRRIYVSVSEPSSALLDATRRKLPNLLRASVHSYNTPEEVSDFVQAVSEIIDIETGLSKL